jgi:hypothetical protein
MVKKPCHHLQYDLLLNTYALGYYTHRVLIILFMIRILLPTCASIVI